MYGREIMLLQETIPFNISISGLHDGIEHTCRRYKAGADDPQGTRADGQRDLDRLEKRANGRELMENNNRKCRFLHLGIPTQASSYPLYLVSGIGGFWEVWSFVRDLDFSVKGN